MDSIFLSSDTIKGTKKAQSYKTKGENRTDFSERFVINDFPLLFCFSYFYIRRFTSCYLLSDSVCSPHEFLIMDYAAACHEDGYKGSQWQY